MFEAFPIIFMERHGLSSSQNGLIFIGVGIGSTIGAVLNWHLTETLYVPHYARWKGFPPAEYRLWGAMVGSPALVIGTFWLGWTGNYESISWVAPAVATIFLGFGIFLIFTSFLVCDPYASSLIQAANSLNHVSILSRPILSTPTSCTVLLHSQRIP